MESDSDDGGGARGARQEARKEATRLWWRGSEARGDGIEVGRSSDGGGDGARSHEEGEKARMARAVVRMEV